MTATIRGIQKAQKANAEHIRALRPGGALGMAVQAGLILTHQSAIRKTHVDTGALRASHRMRYEFTAAGPRGVIYIDPNAENPRSGEKAAVYGPIEHARGGEHAFYARVRDEDGPRISRAVAREFLRGFSQ